LQKGNADLKNENGKLGWIALAQGVTRWEATDYLLCPDDVNGELSVFIFQIRVAFLHQQIKGLETDKQHVETKNAHLAQQVAAANQMVGELVSFASITHASRRSKAAPSGRWDPLYFASMPQQLAFWPSMRACAWQVSTEGSESICVMRE
jgi:hypothetical protein